MNVYLVEITPGRERVYHTLLAFREAIQAGEITPESRIFHRAASRWIPITEHPEYRKHLAERRPSNWLDPIPFEPAQSIEAHDAPHGLRSLVAKLERAGATVRGWFARRPAPAPAPPARTIDVPQSQPPPEESTRAAARTTPRPSSSPTPPSPSRSEEADQDPHQKGWTFLP